MLETNGDRLRDSLLEMGQIGATPAGGVTRTALSDEDRRARDLFATWAREAGLAVRVDDLGDQFARLEGADPAAAPVLIGSHLDSVPAGGRFDGTLGVLVALEVARTLREAGVRPRRSVEVVNFTNEEGARFEPAMLASAVMVGHSTREYAYARTDRDGLSFGAELERIGYRGSPANRPTAVHAYLEVHIEQGPVLEEESLPLAAVEGIVGIQWMNVVLSGQSQHAGTSPMRRRRDALVAAGRIAAGVRDLALEYPDPVAATVGRLQPTPGVINQIPGRVAMGVDLRHPSAAGLEELGLRTEAMVQRIAAEEQVEVQVDVTWKIAPTLFDRELVDLLEREVRALGVSCPRMTSGAGHDAKYLNEIAPTAMLFVRTVGGKSHCETEAIAWDDAKAAADVLLRAVLHLAEG